MLVGNEFQIPNSFPLGNRLMSSLLICIWKICTYPRPGSVSTKPVVFVNDTVLNMVSYHKTWKSMMTSRGASVQPAQHSADLNHACGMNVLFVWVQKLQSNQAVVIATLLHGCESLTTYRRNAHSLDQFHMRCLCRIARIKWQDKIPNTEVLHGCTISGTEALIIRAQL